MLRLIEDGAKKRALQKQLENEIRSGLQQTDRRRLGFRGAGSRNVDIRHNSAIWFYGELFNDGAVRRYWNAFGLYAQGRAALDIVVEVNIAADESTRRIAGSFAREIGTPDVYLMHSGRIGGGRAGIGKEAFLGWSGLEVTRVLNAARHVRADIPVARLGSEQFIAEVEHFVRQVASFKGAVSDGVLVARKRIARRSVAPGLRSVFDEGFGIRDIPPQPARTYYSSHGLVVSQLRKHLETKGRLRAHEELTNSRLVDLAVVRGDRLIAIFEIKTSIDRQSLYCGIGQLYIHSHMQTDARRYLVIPDFPVLGDSLQRTISGLGIHVVTYSRSKDAYRFTGL
jgi:hypothetical protein